MGVITDQEIKDRVQSQNLIENYDESSVQGASYDLRLGRQYVVRGQLQAFTASDPGRILKPGEFAVLTSHEILNLPLDLVGHAGLTSQWTRKGLVSLFSPQIDPGFHGFLTVPVFNAGDVPISLAHQQKIFTAEFIRTATPASYGWSDHHGVQTTIQDTTVPLVALPNLADIMSAMERLQTVPDTIAQLRREFELGQGKADAEILVVHNRLKDVVDRRGLLYGKRQVWVGAIGIVVAIALAVVGYLVGHSMAHSPTTAATTNLTTNNTTVFSTSTTRTH